MSEDPCIAWSSWLVLFAINKRNDDTSHMFETLGLATNSNLTCDTTKAYPKPSWSINRLGEVDLVDIFVRIRRVHSSSAQRDRELEVPMSRTFQQARLSVLEQVLRSRHDTFVAISINPLQGIDTHCHAAEPRRRGAGHRPELELERGIDGLTGARAHEVHAVVARGERAREQADGILAVRDGTDEDVGRARLGFVLSAMKQST